MRTRRRVGRLRAAGALLDREKAGEGCFSSVLFHELVDVSRGHELERNVDLLVDLLSFGEFERSVDRALALARSVLEHSDLEVASLHGSECVLRRVDAADDRL